MFPVEDFLGWESSNHGEKEKNKKRGGWWYWHAECHLIGENRTACSRCRLERQPVTNLFSLLTGHLVICVLKSVTHLVEGNKFGVKVKGLTESSREQLVEASATFISIDNVRARSALGEPG